MNITHELKSLQVRADKVKLEIKDINKEKDFIVENLLNKQRELDSINKKIRDISLPSPIVTEHAMLRYIERVMGVDLEKITNDILTEKNIKIIEFSGNCKITSNNITFIVKDRKVISVVA